MANFKFKGVIPPVSTIFKPDFTFDPAGQANQIEYMIKNGVNGLFFLGTGGEFSQMSAPERKEAARFAIEHVNHRVPVLIGTGSTNQREAVELSLHAKECGADGIVLINPYYWHLTLKNLKNYFVTIANAVAPLPVLLYNFPEFSGQDLTPEFVASVAAECSNIVGIKETLDSIGHIYSMNQKVHEVNPDFAVFCGYDNHLLTNLLSGGAGVISASGNFAPQLTVNTYQAFIKGDLNTACQWHQKLLAVTSVYALDAPFVAVVKNAARLCGVDIDPTVLAPTAPLSSEGIEALKQILGRIGVLN